MDQDFKDKLASFLNDLNQNKSLVFEEFDGIEIISNLTNGTDLKREDSSFDIAE